MESQSPYSTRWDNLRTVSVGMTEHYVSAIRGSHVVLSYKKRSAASMIRLYRVIDNMINAGQMSLVTDFEGGMVYYQEVPTP